jgi:antitoxin component YwqK of YwqJK toxin-antitoxin module
LFGCKPTGLDDPEKRNENWCWFVDKATGEGKWVPISDETTLPDGDYTLFFCDGGIRQTGKLKDKKDCDTIFYYDLTGKIISKVLAVPDSTLKEFMPDGKYKSYYATCEISGEGEFRNNKQIGARIEYYKNGKIKFKSIARADSLIVMSYFEAGNPKDSFLTVNGKREGVAKMWYDNGSLKKQLQYKNGLRDSLCIWYYENGQVDTKCYFKNDNENGYCIAYYENSKVKNEGNFKDGKEDGLIINYFESGQIDSKINWTNGEENGEIWFYHPNGKIKMYAKSNMGVTTYYKSYDVNGKVEEEYKDGNKIDYKAK